MPQYYLCCGNYTWLSNASGKVLRAMTRNSRVLNKIDSNISSHTQDMFFIILKMKKKQVVEVDERINYTKLAILTVTILEHKIIWLHLSNINIKRWKHFF